MAERPTSSMHFGIRVPGNHSFERDRLVFCKKSCVMKTKASARGGIPSAVKILGVVHLCVFTHVYFFDSVLFLIAGRHPCEN